jgi:hypothetical protein
MPKTHFKLSSDSRLRGIQDFWNELRISGDSGATSGEVLETIERQVTECLALGRPDINRAESLTAKACLLIAGQCDL